MFDCQVILVLSDFQESQNLAWYVTFWQIYFKRKLLILVMEQNSMYFFTNITVPFPFFSSSKKNKHRTKIERAEM
jgi:hypothetical protein